MQYRSSARQFTPDTVEILRIWSDTRDDGTPLMRVLFQTPTAIFEESIYQAVIVDFGDDPLSPPDSRFFLEHYATEDGRKFDSIYHRRLPDGGTWGTWAAQMQLDVADVAA